MRSNNNTHVTNYFNFLILWLHIVPVSSLNILVLKNVN